MEIEEFEQKLKKLKEIRGDIFSRIIQSTSHDDIVNKIQGYIHLCDILCAMELSHMEFHQKLSLLEASHMGIWEQSDDIHIILDSVKEMLNEKEKEKIHSILKKKQEQYEDIKKMIQEKLSIEKFPISHHLYNEMNSLIEKFSTPETAPPPSSSCASAPPAS